MKTHKIATVFGGTGFIGSQVVRELAAKGYTVKVATRVPERAYELKTCGTPGQVVPVACGYDEASIATAVKGSDAVVNCIGILYERGKRKFSFVHEAVPQMIAKACKKEKAGCFVHISALGVDKATSRYAASKLAGEQAVRKAFPEAVILRPSVVFGPDDTFFNRFAQLAQFAPMLPLIGGGTTKFQPVFVGDVADAVIAAVTAVPGASFDPRGKIYELAGPEVLSFKEIYERLFYYTHRPRMLVRLPYGVAKVKAAFLGLLPQPPLTCDQVESLKTDNVPGGDLPGLLDMGVQPTGMAQILPSYLVQYKPGGVFAEKNDKKRA
ncbi:MAG: complex I NDUFA9 subunit family protein [Rhodospirillales bacterium]|nr:complex I NDUFA9 subunit family protein [Rhodospirillales bacterium]MCB9997063.1 complex I NDUFA9 subunit family protein [Rhodospirillales bacterium]